MRQKHRNDKNHGKNGWVSGNPRYSRAKAKGDDQKAASSRKMGRN